MGIPPSSKKEKLPRQGELFQNITAKGCRPFEKEDSFFLNRLKKNGFQPSRE